MLFTAYYWAMWTSMGKKINNIVWSKTQEIKNMRYRKAKCIQAGIKGRYEGKKMHLYLLKKKRKKKRKKREVAEEVG